MTTAIHIWNGQNESGVFRYTAGWPTRTYSISTIKNLLVSMISDLSESKWWLEYTHATLHKDLADWPMRRFIRVTILIRYGDPWPSFPTGFFYFTYGISSMEESNFWPRKVVEGVQYHMLDWSDAILVRSLTSNLDQNWTF